MNTQEKRLALAKHFNIDREKFKKASGGYDNLSWNDAIKKAANLPNESIEVVYDKVLGTSKDGKSTSIVGGSVDVAKGDSAKASSDQTKLIEVLPPANVNTKHDIHFSAPKVDIHVPAPNVTIEANKFPGWWAALAEFRMAALYMIAGAAIYAAFGVKALTRVAGM